ncbi:MAG TPA: SMI1/KNR4 family protein [Chloroflexota bacterium]|jgi:hypothetical protein|nr:SMI1/KNR4 family protein [Chloroflexota bacterium]
MDLRYIRQLIEWLNARDVLFERGLTDEEVETLQATYHFRFPPDLRKLLQYALPISERFPNWRGRASVLRESINWPAQGIQAEVEHHGFWLPAWGDRPPDAARATDLIRQLLTTAPPLVPVYAHRYMPCEPPLPGNPLFSVVGTDVIYAGCDLASFFAAEFGVPCPDWAAATPRPIAFWDALIA